MPEKKNNDRGHLYRSLYQSAMANLEKVYQRDGEAVKALRDQTCSDLFDKTYKELTNKELTDTIHRLRVLAGIEKAQSNKLTASKAQIATLKFYAMNFGIRYHNFKNYNFCDKETGLIISGEEARNYFFKRWADKKFVAESVFYNIYKDTINPKSHKFLIEGGFRKFAKNESNFYYEYLRPDEASYLIKRYKAIHSVLETKFSNFDEHTLIEVN